MEDDAPSHDAVVENKQARALRFDGAMLHTGRTPPAKPHESRGIGTLYKDGAMCYRGDVRAGTPHGLGTSFAARRREYVGGFVRGRFEGQGALYRRDELVYTGQFRRGVRSGDGRAFVRGRCVLKGAFAHGLAHGTCEQYDAQGSVLYRGEFSQGQRSGHGAIFQLGSLLYRGAFERGQANGYGTQYDAGGAACREGHFRDGAMEGQGSFFVGGVLRYAGEWVAGRPHGHGTLLENDKRHVGQFEHGLRHGAGTSCGAAVLECFWLADVATGYGTLCVRDVVQYRGWFAGGVRSGRGTSFVEPDVLGGPSLVYEGDWLADVRHGRGELRALSHVVYAGEWAHGLRHGQGTIFFADGLAQYKGTLAADEAEGYGVGVQRAVMPCGRAVEAVYAGQWSGGRPHGVGACTFRSGPHIDAECRVWTQSWPALFPIERDDTSGNDTRWLMEGAWEQGLLQPGGRVVAEPAQRGQQTNVVA